MRLYKTIQKITLLTSISLLASCHSILNSDQQATTETQNVYRNLIQLKQKGFMFGHQDDLAYGVNWKYENGRSDVKEVANDYPAVYGWDIGRIENDSPENLDGVPFHKMRQYIKEVYQRGGVNTISWHINNPFTGGDAWDTTPGSLASVLPNGSKHELFKKWLDKAAVFLNSLKSDDGKSIPVLYRPYHELTGNWFWWCQNNGTPEQFKELWVFSFNYLKSKGVHSLIYVFNTADFETYEDFEKFYPGDQYVDIVSFDAYQYDDPTTSTAYVDKCRKQFKIMNEFALKHNKIMAFAETGFEQIPYENWWTDTLIKAIGNYKISYVLVWRNHGWLEHEQKMHYYAPYKGQSTEKDFKKFYELPNTFFQKEITEQNIYQ
ncbi:glycoside hydrolase family 26 protein [Flavobacterium sp. NRK F10]|uniref:glycoside hydrolase family 26 protein n=1 Tax=Flavobacterium sp. NRK F10 TaxID=2954931 RepID=UPI002090426C|nr:glycosyl hydrolase [Flavobacterium sp. NRK F10]MCO6176042.1 glycoside hydrolase family 26 protein [Flavobacterium sp. NRK F10]